MSAFNRWRTRRNRRLDATVLGCLLIGDVYVYDMMRRTGLGSGVIYPTLNRLEHQRLVWSEWVDPHGVLSTAPVEPLRRRYGLTKQAIEAAGWESR